MIKKIKKNFRKITDTKGFREELASQMLTLATSGLSLVAALAWNQTIQSFVKQFIEPRIPGSGLISQLIYALLITLLAVTITYQLSKLATKVKSRKSK